MASNSLTSILKISKQREPSSDTTIRSLRRRGPIGLRPSGSTGIVTTVGKDSKINRHECFNNLTLRSQDEPLAVFNEIEQVMGREVKWISDLVRAPGIAVHPLDLGLPYLRALAKLYKAVSGDEVKSFHFQQLAASRNGGHQCTQLYAKEIEEACSICAKQGGRVAFRQQMRRSLRVLIGPVGGSSRRKVFRKKDDEVEGPRDHDSSS